MCHIQTNFVPHCLIFHFFSLAPSPPPCHSILHNIYPCFKVMYIYTTPSFAKSPWTPHECLFIDMYKVFSALELLLMNIVPKRTGLWAVYDARQFCQLLCIHCLLNFLAYVCMFTKLATQQSLLAVPVSTSWCQCYNHCWSLWLFPTAMLLLSTLYQASEGPAGHAFYPKPRQMYNVQYLKALIFFTSHWMNLLHT